MKRKQRWVTIAHRLPDRLRLRSPCLRGDPVVGEQVADALAAVPGVAEVRVRPYTGSALIQHDHRVSADALVEVCRRVLQCSHVLPPGEAPPVDEEVPLFSSLARKLAGTVREVDRDILRSTEGAIDLGTLTTLGFLGAGAMNVVLSKRIELPPWFNLAWWAFRTFMTAEQDEILAEVNGHHTHA